MAKILDADVSKSLDKPLTSARSRKRDTLQKPEVRMLTPSEIEELRRDKMESGMKLMEAFRKLPRLLTPEELAAIR